jgi:hypothetical protein
MIAAQTIRVGTWTLVASPKRSAVLRPRASEFGNPPNQKLERRSGHDCPVGQPCRDAGPSSLANSLSQEREKHTMCELEAQFGNFG